MGGSTSMPARGAVFVCAERPGARVRRSWLMRRRAVVLGAALCFAWTQQAKAEYVIYSNLGTGQTFQQGYYSVSGAGGGSPGPPVGYGHAVAESFTPLANYLFSSVELLLGIVQGTNAFTVSLM